jgi:hypothetical protein
MLPRTSAALVEVLIKRDDLTGAELTGNKKTGSSSSLPRPGGSAPKDRHHLRRRR